MPVALRVPTSLSGYNRNWPQEAGSGPCGISVRIDGMESRFPASRFGSQRVWAAGWMLMLTLLVLEWLAGRVSAHAAVVAAPQITLVVFADRTMPDEEWAMIAATLRLRFENLAVETHFTVGGFDVIRGESLAPGKQFEEVIPVYLHGECHLHAQPGTYTIHGALGWVLRDHGTIKPFIHVDCARIAEMLGQHAFGLDKNERNSVMAEAIARVALHEWLHIATQNSKHARDGIFKGSLSITDLLPGSMTRSGQLSRGK